MRRGRYSDFDDGVKQAAFEHAVECGDPAALPEILKMPPHEKRLHINAWWKLLKVREPHMQQLLMPTFEEMQAAVNTLHPLAEPPREPGEPEEPEAREPSEPEPQFANPTERKKHEWNLLVDEAHRMFHWTEGTQDSHYHRCASHERKYIFAEYFPAVFRRLRRSAGFKGRICQALYDDPRPCGMEKVRGPDQPRYMYRFYYGYRPLFAERAEWRLRFAKQDAVVLKRHRNASSDPTITIDPDSRRVIGTDGFGSYWWHGRSIPSWMWGRYSAIGPSGRGSVDCVLPLWARLVQYKWRKRLDAAWDKFMEKDRRAEARRRAKEKEQREIAEYWDGVVAA